MELGFLFSFFIYFLIVPIVTPAPTQTANSLISQFLDPGCSDALQQLTSTFINKTFSFCNRPVMEYSNEFPSRETFLCVGIFRGYSRVCEILKTDKKVLSSMEETFKISGEKPDQFCSEMAKVVNKDLLGVPKDLVEWVKNYNVLISDRKECSNLCFDGEKTVSSSCRVAYSAFSAGLKQVPKVDKVEDPVNSPEQKVTDSVIKPDSIPELDESSGTLKKPMVSDTPVVATKVGSGVVDKPSQSSAQPEVKSSISQVALPPAVDKTDKIMVGPKEPVQVSEPIKPEKTLPDEGTKPSLDTKPIQQSSDPKEESLPKQPEDDGEDTAAIPNYTQTNQYVPQSEKDEFQAGDENIQEGSSLGFDDTLEFEKKRGPGQVQRQRMNTFDTGDDTNFLPYFLLMVVMSAFGYVAFHNKNKLIALVVEGRRSGGRGRSRSRHGSTLYSKLHSNLEETISSNSAAPTASHVLY